MTTTYTGPTPYGPWGALSPALQSALMTKADAYNRGFTDAEARYAPLLEALLELEEAFSFADLPSSGRQDFEERLWALRPRLQDALAAAEGRTP